VPQGIDFGGRVGRKWADRRIFRIPESQILIEPRKQNRSEGGKSYIDERRAADATYRRAATVARVLAWAGARGTHCRIVRSFERHTAAQVPSGGKEAETEKSRIE
jgi:hypothetical protein